MRAVEISDDVFRIIDSNGSHVYDMRRENIETPLGETRWVVRDVENKIIDMDIYRYELFIRMGVVK